MKKHLFLDLHRIRTDGNTQSRVEIDLGTAQEYADLLNDPHHPVEFPPGVVFFDGTDYWLADGFHRHKGHDLAGRKAMCVEVLPGGRREAALYAAGSNGDFGLKRSEADKRKAVWIVLKDADGKNWPVERIARHCKVRVSLVRALQVSTPWQQPDGLFGPDDLAAPPAPDFALEDAEKVRERAWRAGRKYVRHCLSIALNPIEFIRDVEAEVRKQLERKEARKKKHEEAVALAALEAAKNKPIRFDQE